MEDLPVLRALWGTACLPIVDFEKRLTDFQLAQRPDGVVVGTIGFRLSGSHGLLYGECFSSPAQQDQARPVLWQRVCFLARNQGCERLWLKGPSSDFWLATGFRTPAEDELELLPKAFADGSTRWLTFVLREGPAIPEHLAEHLAKIREREQAHVDRIWFQARLFKLIAGLIAVGFLAATGWLLVKLFEAAPAKRFE